MSYTKEHRFDMPDGEVFRTRSARRYVVAVFDRERWLSVYRTDVESRALALWRHHARLSHTACVVDTTTGEVIR